MKVVKYKTEGKVSYEGMKGRLMEIPAINEVERLSSFDNLRALLESDIYKESKDRWTRNRDLFKKYSHDYKRYKSSKIVCHHYFDDGDFYEESEVLITAESYRFSEALDTLLKTTGKEDQFEMEVSFDEFYAYNFQLFPSEFLKMLALEKYYQHFFENHNYATESSFTEIEAKYDYFENKVSDSYYIDFPSEALVHPDEVKRVWKVISDEILDNPMIIHKIYELNVVDHKTIEFTSEVFVTNELNEAECAKDLHELLEKLKEIY